MTSTSQGYTCLYDIHAQILQTNRLLGAQTQKLSDWSNSTAQQTCLGRTAICARRGSFAWSQGWAAVEEGGARDLVQSTSATSNWLSITHLSVSSIRYIWSGERGVDRVIAGLGRCWCVSVLLAVKHHQLSTGPSVRNVPPLYIFRHVFLCFCFS